jgi:hypothetical protein
MIRHLLASAKAQIQTLVPPKKTKSKLILMSKYINSLIYRKPTKPKHGMIPDKIRKHLS